ncbi:uncharacterized protein BDW43DRAFT_14602 [Aspergillus alliaceus]|uniref:uncharacterized protein n=1 Tax=Petromyces alliaceus TaxID=209559 RepID=UPI0012A409EB|nr:uncharacterized protein BDW43DRAFT_14602 [Aspergillus alliaceus]KAB8239870.1 hypothetical protein BDW43DRAFT_14602 [Aspergillus alliaceus]
MAPLAKTLALAGALFAAIASTAPVQKREDGVSSTKTVVQWTTVTVTEVITEDRPTQTATQPVVSVPASSAAPIVTSQPEAKSAEVPDEPEETPEPEQPSYTVQPVWSTSAAPEPTTPTTVAPEPTKQPEPSTASAPPAVEPTQSSTTSAAPQPTGSSSGGYSGSCSEGSPCTGQVTFYDTATSMLNPSSCGVTSDGANEDVLALPVGIMQDGHCGRRVSIKYNGQVKHGKVVDKCMGCDSSSIDLSRHLFNELADESAGRLHGVEWWIE